MQTIGIVVVARCAAREIGVPGVTSISIFCATSSAISAGIRSGCPSALTRFDRQVPADDISSVRQALPESVIALVGSGPADPDIADTRHH
jgi:hypothetical protein